MRKQCFRQAIKTECCRYKTFSQFPTCGNLNKLPNSEQEYHTHQHKQKKGAHKT